MPSAAPAVEFLPRPAAGRVFTNDVSVRLADVDCNGNMRLDATARTLQDIATDDASDAGLDRRFGWLVRRTLIATHQPARLGESITVATWCSGIGRSWAERRSELIGDRGAAIDAVSLWVQVAVETGRPARIGPDFTDAYAGAATGRTVSARLALPSPPERTAQQSWTVRRTDLDPFGHVNNAATWAFLEETAAMDQTDRIGRAELEYLQPIEHDADLALVAEHTDDTITAWLLDGGVRSAARWTPDRD